jgi:RNA polymerase sigma-70 factor (ECF subfamily)
MNAREIAEALAAAAGGDRPAFAAVMRYALPRAWRLAQRLLGNRAEAEDVAQEAMLRLWRHAGRFDPARAPFEAWLARIVTNLATDRLRARTRAGPLLELDDTVPSSAPGAEALLLKSARAAEVAAALQSLPDRQRAAVVLVHYEDFSGAQAAEALGLTAKAVEGLLYRGLKALRESLAREGGLE